MNGQERFTEWSIFSASAVGFNISASHEYPQKSWKLSNSKIQIGRMRLVSKLKSTQSSVHLCADSNSREPPLPHLKYFSEELCPNKSNSPLSPVFSLFVIGVLYLISLGKLTILADLGRKTSEKEIDAMTSLSWAIKEVLWMHQAESAQQGLDMPFAVRAFTI